MKRGILEEFGRDWDGVVDVLVEKDRWKKRSERAAVVLLKRFLFVSIQGETSAQSAW